MNRKIVVWLAVVALAAGVIYLLTIPAPSVNKRIGGEELVRLQKAGAWVVDVRTNSEFVAGHLPNALNVSLDQLATTASSWPKKQAIIVYCATGARSAQAASYLASQGFEKVYDLQNGIAAWTGDVVGGRQTTPVPTGAGVVRTAGKPVFIDFAGST